jgi:predicted dehydrogenase
VNVAILGSGFGLYGYLPALHALSCRVVLPTRYRATIERRPELSQLTDHITFVANDNEAIDLADALVVARRPADQIDLIPSLLCRRKLQRLLLEKPLAPNPAAALRLEDQIAASGKIVRTGYLFGYTDWGRDLIARAAELNDDLHIRWRFRSHHYTADLSNWKRADAEGGGALRFYGIQLISLLAAMGFDQIEASRLKAARPGEAESWRATLTNRKGARCLLELESNAAQSLFAVTAPALGVAISRQDPFLREDPFDAATGGDRRVPLLMSLCREFLTTETATAPSDRQAISLWQAIEDVTTFENAATL